MFSHTVIIALIPGCVEIAKRTGPPSHFAPLAAVLFGIVLVALSFAASPSDLLTSRAIASIPLFGLIDGLAAVGLYQVVPRPSPGE
jgi:hypothetical protein